MWLIFGVTIGICERWLGSTFQGNPVSPGTVSSLRPFLYQGMVQTNSLAEPPHTFSERRRESWRTISHLVTYSMNKWWKIGHEFALQDPEKMILQNINVRVSKFRVHWVFYLSSPLSPRAYELQPFSPWHLANYWEGDICYMRIFQYRPSKLK